MTNQEKINLLSQQPPTQCSLVEFFQGMLDSMGDIKRNYGDYMTTTPIDCNAELQRVASADYDLCCALMTMLFREDHFAQYGCFDNRYNQGDVQPIINRMIELLK